MRLDEIEPIAEVSVISSWISDLNWDDGSVIMTLNNGREYRIHNINPITFRRWLKSSSKGKFWHSDIKGLHNVTRI